MFPVGGVALLLNCGENERKFREVDLFNRGVCNSEDGFLDLDGDAMVDAKMNEGELVERKRVWTEQCRR